MKTYKTYIAMLLFFLYFHFILLPRVICSKEKTNNNKKPDQNPNKNKKNPLDHVISNM